MTPFQYLSRHGFRASDDQPVGASDYVGHAGIFRVRVRVPRGQYETRPALWVGFTAGGPLVERASTTRYQDVGRAMDDAVLLLRLFMSSYRG